MVELLKLFEEDLIFDRLSYSLMIIFYRQQQVVILSFKNNHL